MKVFFNHQNEPRTLGNETLLQIIENSDNCVKIEGDVWIKPTGDGRYYDGETEYREVCEYDETNPTFDLDEISNYDGEITLIGYVEV